MTIPIERSWAIRNVENFLLSLLNPKKTPKVPRAVRRRASQLLKHFPTGFDMTRARKKAPDLFGTPKEGGDDKPYCPPDLKTFVYSDDGDGPLK